MEKSLGKDDPNYVRNRIDRVRLDRNISRRPWLEELRTHFKQTDTSNWLVSLSYDLYPNRLRDHMPVESIMALEDARTAFFDGSLMAQALLDEVISREGQQLIYQNLVEIVGEAQEFAALYGGKPGVEQEGALCENIKGYAALASDHKALEPFFRFFEDSETLRLFRPAYIDDAEDGFGLVMEAAARILDPKVP